MHKQLTQFKSVINGIENYFHFDASCPVAIAKEALFECLKWVGQIEDAAKEAKKASDDEPKSDQQDEQKIEPIGNEDAS